MTSATTHDFLEALDLDDEANLRDIRLAYARKLKQLDLAAAPAAFQALRDTYEAALAWAQDDARTAPAAP
jgi:hypothetical protein